MSTSFGGASSIFPLPFIPMPRVLSRVRPSKRNRRRFRSSCSVSQRVNLVISGLNSLYSNSSHHVLPTPSVAGPSLFATLRCSLRVFLSLFPSFKVSALQSRLLLFVYNACCRSSSMSDVLSSVPLSLLLSLSHTQNVPPSYSLSSLGDALHRPQDSLIVGSVSSSMERDLLSVLPTHLASMSGTSAQLMPLIAKRVALPDSLCQVDLISLLPPAIAPLYASPSPSIMLAVPRESRITPHVFASSHTEYMLLIERMKSIGMIDFTSTPKCVNGLFGTSKPDGSIRLILDARPANCYFVDCPQVVLPTPTHISRLSVTANASYPLYISKIDLTNFYHQLRLPDWICDYFCLPAMTVDGVTMYPRIRTLPMGFSHSVYLAQCVNEHVLYSPILKSPTKPSGVSSTPQRKCPPSVVTHTDNILTLSSPFMAPDQVVHSAYIDDLFFLSTDREALSAAHEGCKLRYAYVQLPVNSKKEVPPTRDGAELLGVRVDSLGCRLDASKMNQLIESTLLLLKRGWATGVQLSNIVSSWTWCMLLSRPALSVFSVVYGFIERAKKSMSLWPSVRRELLNAIFLCPLYFSSFSSRFSTRLIATDASLSGAGVVCSRFNTNGDDLFHVMWSTAISKHGLLAYTPCVKDDNILDGGESTSPYRAVDCPKQPVLSLSQTPDPCHQLLSHVDAIDSWSIIMMYPFKYPPVREGDIAALEFEAVLSALKWYLSFPSSVNSRLLTLNDNSNVFYALHKGRISSFNLLRIQRKINALLLASGVSLYVSWIPSAHNPADGASRVFELLPP